MNWSKAKTILIFFLSCVTIFLLCVLIFTSIETSKTTDEVISYSVEILSNHGIKINPELIMKKSQKIQQITVANIISDKQAFADLIVGEATENIAENSYKSQKATITYSGDTFTAEFSTPIPSENLQEYLQSAGIDISDSFCRQTETSKIYTKKISDIPIFDCSIIVSESATGINELHGCWFNIASTSTNKVQLKPMADALVEFALKNDFSKKPLTIQEINLVYATGGNNEYQIQTTLTPMYELITDSGAKYHIDARNF